MNCSNCRQPLPADFKPPTRIPAMPSCLDCLGTKPPRKIVWRNGYSYAVPCDHRQPRLETAK